MASATSPSAVQTASSSELLRIPVISLAGWFSGDAPSQAAVVSSVADACSRCGFFQVSDHRVPASIVARAWSASRAFFDSPLSNKASAPQTADYPYGYVAMEKEIAGGSLAVADEYGVADRKESFAIALGSSTGASGVPPPRWPPAPPELPEALSDYFYAMEALARQLLAIFARALALPDGFFTPLEDAHWSALRVLNYPHADAPFRPGQMRIAPHTDYGTLTILRADNAPGGLQVRGPREEWLEVEFPGDVFTVNLGDLMQRWTNDRWRSTLHRVVPPPPPPPGAAAADTRRQSIAYFHNLNRAAVCETFPSCIDDAHPRRYAPVKAFDHLMSRHAAATGGTAPLRSGGEGEEGGEAATS